MGNCLVKPSDKGTSSPRRNSAKPLEGDEAPKQLIEQPKKRFEVDDKDDQSIVSNSGATKENVQRGQKRAVGKIKKGEEKLDSDIIYENVKKNPNRVKKESDVKFMISCFKNHFVFSKLEEAELAGIIDKMFHCEVPANEYIFKQGGNASSYFILEKGSLEVYVNEKLVRTLKPGDGFGELALLYGAPRSASIKATETSQLWGIDRHTFRKAIEEMTAKEYEENRKFIDAVKFFNSMTSDQKDAIAGVLISQKFTKGQNIVNEGDQADSFYIIKEGSVSVLKGGKELRKMYKGDSFGEQALYYNTVRGATVKVLDNVVCLALGRDTVTKILGDQVQIVTFRNIQKWAFDKSENFSKLTKIQIEKIIDSMKIINYKAGDIVCKKGANCSSKIYVSIEGNVKKSKSGSIAFKKGELFGDAYVLEANKNKTFDEDWVMESDGVVAEISIETFNKCIGGNYEDIIKKNEKSHEKKMMNITSALKEIGKSVKLEDLVFYKKLGFGQFGSVYLVRVKGNDQFFALKCVSKQQVVEQRLEKHLMQEKAVLEVVNFPFIMQFIKTYKDNNYIYFLVEYVKGMELFDVIRDIGLLSTYDSQFYIGSLILALEYLHAQSIIYRDIKPENIMVDHTGYMKMIDMGTAKFLKGKAPGGNRTFTIIGTPHYMAPEIITGKGYTLAVDLWSVGICLYEFMCGMCPFGEEAEDPFEIYEEIITKPIKYPQSLKDKKARRLMDQLINKVAEVRLGGSYAALKANPWFENFDWDKLLDKELKAPYFPPKEKMISDADIKKMDSLGKKVITEIEEEQKHNPRKYKKEQAEDPNWDKNF